MRDLSNIILNNKYQFTKKIGAGSYGIVYSARHLYSGKDYAIKIILKNQSCSNGPNGNHNNKQLLVEMEKSLLYQALMNNGTLITNMLSLDMIERKGYHCKILREISLHLRVHKHPNVLSIYKVYDSKEALFVVMDNYPDGDLFGTIVDKQRYKNDPFLVKAVFIQLVDAITYCHSKGVYHCDMKPENVLVSKNGTHLVLADFGLALREPYIESNVCCGSSYYMSPERIQNFCQGFDSQDAHVIHMDRLLHPRNDGKTHKNVRFPTAAGDVWSLAIILINLVSIRNPWLKASLNDTTFRAFAKDPAVLLKILPISKDLFKVICHYLKINPWERGNLFEMRHEILACAKLTESGPLSIDSRIQSMALNTSDSQRALHLDTCAVPIDHVAMNRASSQANGGIENIEQETNYIIGLPLPDADNVATAATSQAGWGPGRVNGVCGSCVACGYGGPQESIEDINIVPQEFLDRPMSSEQAAAQQHSLSMQHSRKNPNVLRKIFSRHHQQSQHAQHAQHAPQQQVQSAQPGQQQAQYAPQPPRGQSTGFPGFLGKRVTEENLKYHNRRYPAERYSKVRVNTLLENCGVPEHTSGEESTTDTTNGVASNSSASSVEDPDNKVEVMIHKSREGINNVTEDLSMVSIMSVKNSSNSMSYDY